MGQERERKAEHVSRPFYGILFVVLTSLSRYYYFRLLGDESPFVAIIAGFMTDAVHNNTLSPIRAEPLRKIMFFVVATDSVFELLKYTFVLYYSLVVTIVLSLLESQWALR